MDSYKRRRSLRQKRARFTEEKSFVELTLFFTCFDDEKCKKKSYVRRDIFSMSDEDCRREFRFTLDQMQEMVEKLKIENPYVYGNRRKSIPALNALALLLARLSSSSTMYILGKLYGWSVSSFSEIVNSLARDLCERFESLICCNVPLFKSRLILFDAAIQKSGCCLKKCVGFVDGTCREISRPLYNQVLHYSGKVKEHCIKFQAVTTPDGLCTHLFGPFEGTKHDQTLYNASGVEELFQQQGFNSYCVFGDQGYANSGHLVSPYDTIHNQTLSAEQLEFNLSMNRARVAVEHGYMLVTQAFRLFHDHTKLKIGLVEVAKLYKLAVFFTNIKTCFNGGNQISTYFDLSPPSLDEYLFLG
jgi:hypothetical protein